MESGKTSRNTLPTNNFQVKERATSFRRLDEFCNYSTAIRGRSEKTIREYRYDLSFLFRYLLVRDGQADSLEEADLVLIDDAFLQKLSLSDLYDFIGYLASARGNSPATRARRVSTIRAFFLFLTDKAGVLTDNIALKLESPKTIRRLPRYLSLEQSRQLLTAADDFATTFSERDYLILTLLLNCGLRLAELCQINLSDIHEDTLVVMGKGKKERTIYLNDACMVALGRYLDVRPRPKKDEDALFISRLGGRIGERAVQNVVKKYLELAGLDKTRFSTHKLRHTAATLMYQYGQVDLRSLQTILGHESVATTEIYTHINADNLHRAVERHPLAGERPQDDDT